METRRYRIFDYIPFYFRDLIPTQPVNRKLSKVSNILGPYRKEEHKGGTAETEVPKGIQKDGEEKESVIKPHLKALLKG